MSSVPARPNLTYSVEQRREIVAGLVADLDNARYTNQDVRFRTGQSGLPPSEGARSDGAALAERLIPAPEAVEAGPAAPRSSVVAGEPGSEDTFASEDDSNDGSLGNFVRDLVRETDPGVVTGPDDEPASTGAPSTSLLSPVATSQVADAGAAAPVQRTGSNEGAGEAPREGFFSRIGKWFGVGGEPEDPPVEADQTQVADQIQVKAASDQHPPQNRPAVVPAVSPPAPDDAKTGEETTGSGSPHRVPVPEVRPEVAEGPPPFIPKAKPALLAHVPRIKPTEIAQPPVPGPRKPIL